MQEITLSNQNKILGNHRILVPKAWKDWSEEVGASQSQGSLSPAVTAAAVLLLLFSLHAGQLHLLHTWWKGTLHSFQVFSPLCLGDYLSLRLEPLHLNADS